MEAWIFIFIPSLVFANITLIDNSAEEKKIDLLIDLIVLNLKNNGWNNFITHGNLPDYYYNKLKLSFTYTTSNVNADDLYVDEGVPYHSAIIVIDCFNITHFETSLRQVMRLPYWYPHSNTIIIYRQANKLEITKLLFILWYYRMSNSIVIQYDDTKHSMHISQFDPFVVDFDSPDTFGCRTARAIGMPINKFETSFICEWNCQNVTSTSKNRHSRLGTCMKLQTNTIHYDDRKELIKHNFFEDRGKDLHGFGLRTFTTEVIPFLIIKEVENGKFELTSRDGIIWSHLAKLMNFTIDLTPSVHVLGKFNFQLNIEQIYTVAQRQGDLFLIPIYQFDVVVIEIDYSFPYKDSGVCFISHKAEYETVLFDLKTLQDNVDMVMEFSATVFCIWLVFFLYSALEADTINLDLFGKNLMNTIRSALSITLFNPPKRQSFRLFLTIILWSFFVLNFSTQAAIISFFSAFKRGQEVETYADIVEKGYKIQGVASPDMVLPAEENPLFEKINSKLEPINYMYSCVKVIANDTHRFCLLDCSVAHWMKFNFLDSKGEQYLHISRDRVHSYYLNFVFPKFSVLSEYVNKYLMIFVEGGFILKWEQFRFNRLKEESPVKALGMEEFKGIFNVYLGAIAIASLIFLTEVLVGNFKRMKQYLLLTVKKWKRTRAARKIVKLERKQNKITNVCNSTQT